VTRTVPLLALILAACQQDTPLPITYQTEHLDIGVDLDHPLCRGDLDALERIIFKVQDELEVEMDGVTTVYVWDDERWWSGPNQNCHEDAALGCFELAIGTISTSYEALNHELVHATMGFRGVHPFFDESVADIYAGDQTRFGNSLPSDSAGTDQYGIDHATGRHFVRWLRERWGVHRLAQLLASGESTFENFGGVYGLPLSEAEAMYVDDAPFGYPSLNACTAATLAGHASQASTWAAQLRLDCDADSDTRVAGDGMIVHRTFTIVTPGLYSISTDAEWFDIFRCSDARADEPQSGDNLKDAPAHHAGYPSGAYRRYDGGGEVHALELEAGTHDIGVGLLGHGSGVAELMIWPN
jgi:hypothetical protein